MRRRVCIYRRRTNVFRRQRLQERAQALQRLQSETGRGRRWRRARLTDALGNEDKLFAVREGNHGSLPAHAGPPGFLPGMLPAAKSDGRSVKQRLEIKDQKLNRQFERRNTLCGTDRNVCRAFFWLARIPTSCIVLRETAASIRSKMDRSLFTVPKLFFRAGDFLSQTQ
jgi:hypothetical protein